MTSSDPKVRVTNEELVSVREAMRGLNAHVEDIEAGRRSKVVLVHRGKMVAALVPLGSLEWLQGQGAVE
jgi:antitoxin (DNA-binding transcriptional repressor) of toxin-antitoxin stability system